MPDAARLRLVLRGGRGWQALGAYEQGASVTANRWLTVGRTLCFITNGDAVLLMKRGEHRRIFPGYYNGIGGHLERDEDPLSGARREILEETGLQIPTLAFRGAYNINTGDETGILLFIFTGHSATRHVIDDCEEGTLHWVSLDQALDLKVVEDIPYLWPRLFGAGANDPTPFFAHVSYDAGDQMVMRFAEEVSHVADAHRPD